MLPWKNQVWSAHEVNRRRYFQDKISGGIRVRIEYIVNLKETNGHRGLPVGFLLLRYSVLFTVESLSLLYLRFISWLICSRRWCIDKLGVFMQTKHLCISIHIWTKAEVGAPWNRFKPSSKIFFYMYWPFQGGASFVDLFDIGILFLSCFCYAFVRARLLMPCEVLDCIDSWSSPSFLL